MDVFGIKKSLGLRRVDKKCQLLLGRGSHPLFLQPRPFLIGEDAHAVGERGSRVEGRRGLRDWCPRFSGYPNWGVSRLSQGAEFDLLDAVPRLVNGYEGDMLRLLPFAALDLTGLELDALPLELHHPAHDLVDERIGVQVLRDRVGDLHRLRAEHRHHRLPDAKVQKLFAEAAARLGMATLELVLRSLVAARPAITVARPERLAVPRSYALDDGQATV